METRAGVRELKGFVSFLTGCGFSVRIETDELGGANVEVRGTSIAPPQSQLYLSGVDNSSMFPEKAHKLLMIGLFERLAADFRKELDAGDEANDTPPTSPTTLGGSGTPTLN